MSTPPHDRHFGGVSSPVSSHYTSPLVSTPIRRPPSTPSSTSHSEDAREMRRSMMRQRCLDRARSSRNRRLEVARQIGTGARTQEAALEALKKEIENGDFDDDLHQLEEDVFREIIGDLLAKEEFILREIEREERLQQLDIEQCNKLRGEGPFVLCPICVNNYLYISNSVIHCQCGMRIDTKDDNPTLELIQTRLSMAHASHATCPGKLEFHIQTQFGPALLACRCITCGFFKVVY